VLYSIPIFCQHCEEAYCEAVCPAHAIERNSEGALIVNEKKCLGCKLCEIACPIGAIAVNPEKGVSLKCDRCTGLGGPQCVKYCYRGALKLIPGERVGLTLARAKAQKFVEMARREA
jgi:carbon-monoxide dehydrogenase iron sulfur subunit